MIADGGSCRIFRSDENLDRFALVHALENEERPDPDALGPRGSTRAAPGGARSAYDRHTDPHDMARRRFADRVADVVSEAFGTRRYERLVLAAPPKFLGDLRASLPRRVTDDVVATIGRDFAHVPAHELPEAVRRHLPVTAGMP